jgi:acyl-coenzyme A thioesterase PaaI-like protein
VLELPHTQGCLVCGKQNPHGLHLSLFVDESTNIVSLTYTPLPEHIGFEGIVHGGILATVLDEAMVWAATWHNKIFCVAGEMNIRFRLGATVGEQLNVTAQVLSQRRNIIETVGQIRSPAGVVATATGKYIPVSPDRNKHFLSTLVSEPSTTQAARLLTRT